MPLRSDPSPRYVSNEARCGGTEEFVGDDVRAHFLFQADLAEGRHEVDSNFPSEMEALLF
jgi:hypothetical protein